MTKRNIIISLSLLVFTLAGAVLITESAYAAATKCPGGYSTSVLPCFGEGEGALMGIVKWVIQILTGGIGVAAVGAVIVGAILYMSSGSNPENMKKAKTIWMNTIIGLVIFAFLVAITNFIIPGGVFGPDTSGNNNNGGGGGAGGVNKPV